MGGHIGGGHCDGCRITGVLPHICVCVCGMDVSTTMLLLLVAVMADVFSATPCTPIYPSTRAGIGTGGMLTRGLQDYMGHCNIYRDF